MVGAGLSGSALLVCSVSPLLAAQVRADGVLGKPRELLRTPLRRSSVRVVSHRPYRARTAGEEDLTPSHVVTLTSRRNTLPPAMRTRTTPPSPTRDAASLRSHSRSPRARSPRPTTARPPTAPPTDPPRESARVSAPSCPCSWSP